MGNMQNEVFEQNKCATLHCLEKINSVAKQLQFVGVAEKSGKDIEQLRNEKFTLVVIGEFSRGKSTFVNALLGVKILPSSKEPTTNVISKIVYGNTLEFLLHYKDGRVESVSEEAFQNIKAQSEPSMTMKEQFQEYIGKMQDFNQIEFVEIRRPLEFCKNNVELVDTPGTNDLNVGRMEITYNYLNKADAAILVLSATQAYSKSEDEFLQERVLGNQIKDIFVVVNYKDQLDSDQQEDEVKAYVKKQIDDLEKRSNADLSAVKNRIFMISSRQALLFRRKASGEVLKAKMLMDVPQSLESTGFVDFEETLGKYLFTERGNTKIEKYSKRCDSYLTELEQFIADEKKASSKSVVELKKIQSDEKHRFSVIQKRASDIAEGLKRRLYGLEGDFIALSNRTSSLILTATRTAVVEYEQSHEDNFSIDELQYAVSSAVTPIQKRFIEEVNDIQKKKITTECLWASNELKKIWDDIVFKDMVSEISNLNFSGADLGALSDEMQKIKSDGDSFWGDALIGGASYLAYTFFGPFAGVLAFAGLSSLQDDDRIADLLKVKSKIKVRIYEQIQNNVSGLSDYICSEYRKLVDNVCSEIMADINRRISDMQNQTSRLIQMKEQEKESIEESVGKLDEMLIEIHQVKNDLKGVKL